MPPPTPTPWIEFWIYKITVTYCWFSFMYYEESKSKKNKKRVHCIIILAQPATHLFLFFVNNLRDIWAIYSLSTALFMFRWSISEDHKIERKELSANTPQSLLKYNAAIAGSAMTNNRTTEGNAYQISIRSIAEKGWKCWKLPMWKAKNDE